MNAWMGIVRMDMKNMIQSPVLIGFNTIFVVLMILSMGFLTSGAYAQSLDAYRYYAVSILVYAMLNGAMTATNCFMERDVKRPNLRIIHSPAGSFSIYFSKMISSFVFNTICHLLVMSGLVWLLGLPIDGRLAGLILLLMIPVEFAACALGILFCCVYRSEEGASTLLSSVISLGAFLGGTFFSWEGLGGTMAFLSKLSPVKWLNDAFFAMVVDGASALYWPVWLGSVGLSLLSLLGCRLLFRTEDYL
ncbi:ABC transporter permease [Paenibacillus filicis]|uniref:ABC transporter permease n=1 Tax=Paenibacillus filicis TaxID=669464 RepID=A0ABU9DEI4_9BACL